MPSFFIDLERLKYPNNGLYQFDLHLANELVSLINQDEKLLLYAPSSAIPSLHKNNNTSVVKYLPWHKLFSPKNNTDVWHITHQGSYFSPRHKNTKCLLTIHDLNFLYTSKSSKSKSALLQSVQQKINRADHIVTISNFIKQEITKHLDVSNKPITVIYNGYSLIDYNENANINYIPKNEFYFTIGALHPKKNMHVLTALLVNNNKELIIAGSGYESYKNEIIAEAKKYGVENRVKFIGTVNEEQKVWYYKNCSAFLFPSISEGFGIPVLEAMSLGKPTFLSNLTSLPEIGSSHAYYFQSFDAEHMHEVLNTGLAKEDSNTVANRILYAKQFSWNKMASEYLRLYRSLATR